MWRWITIIAILALCLVAGCAGAETTTVNVGYSGANGYSNHNATVLTGQEQMPLEPGWYVVSNNINYSGTLTFKPGEVHIIICNACEMEIGTSSKPVSGKGIDFESGGAGSMYIYGQNGSGEKINIYSTDTGITAQNYTQYGATIKVDSDSSDGIYADTFNLCGGNLNINAGLDGVYVIPHSLRGESRPKSSNSVYIVPHGERRRTRQNP